MKTLRGNKSADQPILLAAVQMTSTDAVLQNLKTAERLIGEAAARSAQLVLLPENFAAMALSPTQSLAIAEVKGDGPIQSFLSSMAKRHRIWLVGGTVPTRSPKTPKLCNTCFAYSPEGKCVAQYDKIHLFRFVDERKTYDESATFEAGSRIVEFDTPFAHVGVSVCYDIRFPELYRLMQLPDLVVVPAAFTKITGSAHWEILLCARAIENQCYVLAAAQCGTHADGRETYGHSLLVDPWGKIVDVAAESESVLVAPMSPALVYAVRNALPAQLHRKILVDPGIEAAFFG